MCLSLKAEGVLQLNLKNAFSPPLIKLKCPVPPFWNIFTFFQTTCYWRGVCLPWQFRLRILLVWWIHTFAELMMGRFFGFSLHRFVSPEIYPLELWENANCIGSAQTKIPITRFWVNLYLPSNSGVLDVLKVWGQCINYLIKRCTIHVK